MIYIMFGLISLVFTIIEIHQFFFKVKQSDLDQYMTVWS